MTANAMKEDEAICREAGMDSYISKPVREKEIYAVVRKIASVVGPSATSGPVVAPHMSETVAGPPESDPKAAYAAAAVADCPDIFDRRELLERLGGEEALIEIFVDKFIVGVTDYLSNLGEALLLGDMEAIHFRAHTIAGTAANMGAPAIRSIAARLESLAKAGDRTELMPLYEKLQEAFAIFKTAVSRAPQNLG